MSRQRICHSSSRFVTTPRLPNNKRCRPRRRSPPPPPFACPLDIPHTPRDTVVVACPSPPCRRSVIRCSTPRHTVHVIPRFAWPYAHTTSSPSGQRPSSECHRHHRITVYRLLPPSPVIRLPSSNVASSTPSPPPNTARLHRHHRYHVACR
jgi:hypothetical protein